MCGSGGAACTPRRRLIGNVAIGSTADTLSDSVGVVFILATASGGVDCISRITTRAVGGGASDSVGDGVGCIAATVSGSVVNTYITITAGRVDGRVGGLRGHNGVSTIVCITVTVSGSVEGICTTTIVSGVGGGDSGSVGCAVA